MRGSILLLVGLILALIANIIAYSVNEDYRFFVKKIKYRQEPVYESGVQVDDELKSDFLQEDTDTWTQEIQSEKGVTFLEALNIERDPAPEADVLPELTQNEKKLLEALEEKFVLTENISTTSLFDITTEYPDEYREYGNKHVSLYIFPTKSYDQVYKIFSVLSYELPYSINEVNNFADQSFYINLQGVYSDDKVRIVGEYQNRAFGLKIKKDSYNTVKQIFNELEAN